MPIFKQVLAIGLSLTLVSATEATQINAAFGAGVVAFQNQSPQPAPGTVNSAPSPEVLQQLVAPIALYPDSLVAQILAGSTYPTQVVEAARWVTQNSNLQGEQFVTAVDKQPWDPSIKALTQFPSVLQNMNTNLSWTSSLGDAYFNVPADVMAAIQTLRRDAQHAGNLNSSPQQTVSTEGSTIVIAPADPEVVYVPTYSPAEIYGQPIASYPGYSGWAVAGASAISFGVGVAVGAAFGRPWGWGGWGTNWHGGNVVYNRNTFVSRSNTFVNRNTQFSQFNRANINNANINRANINRGNVNNANINRGNINNSNINRNNLNQADRARANTQLNKPNNMPAGGFNNQNFANRDHLNSAQSRGFSGGGDRYGGGNAGAFGGFSQGGAARMDSSRGQSSFGGGGFSGGGGGGGGRSRGGGGGRRR